MPRAIFPVLGAVLLVGVTVLLAVALTVVATGFALPEATKPVVIEAQADAANGRVTLDHVAGPELDVRRLSIKVEINGEALLHQPPVPFYAAAGFNGFPTGPFNPSTDPTWSVGEAASFRIAGTNDPPLVRGATLSLTITRDGQLLARVTTTVS